MIGFFFSSKRAVSINQRASHLSFQLILNLLLMRCRAVSFVGLRVFHIRSLAAVSDSSSGRTFFFRHGDLDLLLCRCFAPLLFDTAPDNFAGCHNKTHAASYLFG